MKKKGFTLIELLAVIVTLAVIAVIITPMILGVIEKARKSAAESSALGYIDAIEKQIALNEINTSEPNIEDGIYEVPMDNIEQKGKEPTSGWIEIKKGIVIDYSMTINEYLVTKKEATIKSERNSQLVFMNLLKEIKEKVTTETQEGLYFIDENGNLDYGKDNISIDLNKTEVKGNVSIYNNQVTYACFNFENENYEYKGNKIKKRKMPCLTERYSNLVINGDMQFNDNTNFDFGIYEDESIKFSIQDASKGYILTAVNDYIPIDTNKTYELGITLKSSNDKSKSYAGFREYDVDYNVIVSSMYMYVPNTLTTLAKDLKDGDTIIYLSDLTNWDVESKLNNRRGIIFWNYKDSTGYEYPELTYSRNVFQLYKDEAFVDKTNNTITLSSPWSSGTVKAGTKLSQKSDGSTMNYILFTDSSIPQEFTTYSYSGLTGVFESDTSLFNNFRPGTKYIRMGIYNSRNSIPDTTISIKNMYFKEIEM